jgi:DNA-binding FadR family transcriptional regulator
MSEPGSLIRGLAGRQAARNFHTFVIGEIGVDIASGRAAVGSILPNDADMMARYGVSRTVLREALKTLEAKGMVEARPKVGTRVLPRSRWNLFDRQVLGWVHEAGPDAAFMAWFADVRVPLELQTARLAAQNRTADQLRQLFYWLGQRQATARMPEPFAMAEFELHRTLADASGNPFLRAASPLSEFGVLQAVTRRLTGAEVDLACARHPAYAALLSAVEARAPAEAAAAMTAVLAPDDGVAAEPLVAG